MHEGERGRDGGALTTRTVVAAPIENRARTCNEAVGDWSLKNCETDYDHLSSSAGRCCGGGASYCPAPQLCADPAAFDPAALYEYLCYGYISAEFTDEQCLAVGCHAWNSEGQGKCSCMQVTDSEACLAKLPGELSRARVLCEVDGCMRASEAGMAGR